MANLKDCSTCENDGNYQKCGLCLGCVDHDQYVPKSSFTYLSSAEGKLKIIKEPIKHADSDISKTVTSKDDCEYFGLRTINKPCYTCKKLCPYAQPCPDLCTGSFDGIFIAKDVKEKKYGVGELPYLGGPLNWVHIFDSEEDADAYYSLVKDSCTKSKINVHIIKFTINDEIKLKDGRKVED